MLIVFYSVVMLSGFVFYIAVIDLPQRFQIVDHNSAVIAGVKLLPMMASSALGSLIGGAINTKKNLTPFTLMAGSAFQLLGYGLMSTLGDDSPTPSNNFGFQVLLGFGFGMIMPTVTIMGTLHAPKRWLCKSRPSVQQVVVANSVRSRHARCFDPDEVAWREHWSGHRRNCVQQPDQSFDGTEERALSR